MDFNFYDEVINGEHTYSEISKELKLGRSVIIGWTDDEFTHYDLLFNYNTHKQGSLQRGLRGMELYVSVIGLGAFGFDVSNSDKSAGYIAEKLNINGDDTTQKVAELINNIIKRL